MNKKLKAELEEYKSLWKNAELRCELLKEEIRQYERFIAIKALHELTKVRREK